MPQRRNMKGDRDSTAHGNAKQSTRQQKRKNDEPLSPLVYYSKCFPLFIAFLILNDSCLFDGVISKQQTRGIIGK